MTPFTLETAARVCIGTLAATLVLLACCWAGLFS